MSHKGPPSIGARIKAHRLARGLSLADVAKAAYGEGKAQRRSYIHALESDGHNPSLSTLALIAAALGLDDVSELWKDPDGDA